MGAAMLLVLILEGDVSASTAWCSLVRSPQLPWKPWEEAETAVTMGSRRAASPLSACVVCKGLFQGSPASSVASELDTKCTMICCFQKLGLILSTLWLKFKMFTIYLHLTLWSTLFAWICPLFTPYFLNVTQCTLTIRSIVDKNVPCVALPNSQSSNFKKPNVCRQGCAMAHLWKMGIDHKNGFLA